MTGSGSLTLTLCHLERVQRVEGYNWVERRRVGGPSLARAATSTIFVATKVCMSQQNLCRDKYVFVATKVLLRQAYFCRDKRRVLSQQTRISRDKSKLVATKHTYPLLQK